MRSLSSATAWWTVLLLGLLYIVSFVDRLALSLLVQPIQADLGLTDTQMGLLLGASFAFFYALFGLPLSLVADRGNRRWLVVAGVVLWSATTVLSGFANGFIMLLLCRLGVGLGEAVLSPAAISMIGDLFTRERRALPLAVFVTLGAFGAAGSFILAAAVLQWVGAGLAFPFVGVLEGWRATLVLIGLPGLVLAGVFAATVREPARTGPPSTVPPLTEAWRHFVPNARTYIGVFGGVGIAAMIGFGSAAWFPTFLVRAYGVTPQAAGYAYGGAAMLGAVSGAFTMPLLADRLLKLGFRDGLILPGLVCIVLTAGFFIPAFTAPDFRTAVIFSGLGAFVLAALNQLPALTIQLVTPARLRGFYTASYLCLANIMGLGLGPSVVAFLSDRWFPTATGLGEALTTVAMLLSPLVFLLLLQAWRPARRSLRDATDLEADHDNTAD